MKKVVLNEQALTGITVYEIAPVGSIMIWFSENLPTGWLKCAHIKLAIADYPQLYNIVKDIPQCQSTEEGYFYTPDFRETTIVGVGENGTHDIASHDVYDIGQFKDDQLQGHNHGIASNNTGGRWSSGSNAVESGYNYPSGPLFTTDTGRQSGLPKKFSDEYGEPRIGKTTHGKQTGAHYIIKATNYVSLTQEAIDDSKTTVGNTWSAAEINKRNSYSEEEVVIGEYLGKPLYRRGFINQNISAVKGWISTSISVANMKKIVRVNGIDASENDCTGLIQLTQKSSGYLRLLTTDVWGISDVFIEYTKTTD